ncbi:MAG: peptidyl-prolyl cis-trans isomerase, partial [Rhizobiales bacterium]|nr:peptidyl-prolyl cis-trans isomerase [Hyphomicrobiales bacterium]
LKTRIIEAISNNGNGPDGKPVTGLPEGVDVLSAAFNAEVDGENEPLRLPNRGGYVWYNVDAVTPARDRPLDEVKDQVIARWRNDQIAQRLEAKAKEMLDKIKAGTSFADVVAAEKLKTEWRPGIKRGNPPAGLTAAAVTAVFRTAQGESGSVEGASPTERLLFRVTEAKVPPLDPQSAEAKRLEEALRSRNAEDLVAEYVAKLQADAGVTINQNALNQAVGGSSQNF